MADDPPPPAEEEEECDEGIRKQVAQKMHRLDLLNSNNSDNDGKIFLRDRLLCLNAVLSCGVICALLEFDYEWRPSVNGTAGDLDLDFDEWVYEHGGSSGLVPGRFISTDLTMILKCVLSLLTLIAVIQASSAIARGARPRAACPRRSPRAPPASPRAAPRARSSSCTTSSTGSRRTS
jgi:hypothetical protein